MFYMYFIAGCSHERSWMYFVESLKRNKAFPAIAAASCDTWKTGKRTNQIIYLGDNLDERYVFLFIHGRPFHSLLFIPSFHLFSDAVTCLIQTVK